MKKMWLMFAILLVAVGAANAYQSGADLAISISKYEPYPAEPGRYIEVWISIQNTGNAIASNVQIEVTPNYPFSVEETDSGIKSIGDLMGGERKILLQRVRVDQNAVQGSNNMDLRYKFGSYDWTTLRIPVFVQTHDSILAVKGVYTEPQLMVPGQTSRVVFELENMADSFLSDIRIRLDFITDNLPFSPIESTTEKRIYVMESGKTEEVEFKIMTLPDAKSGIYRVPIEISYSDSVGNSYTRTDITGWLIGDNPKLDMYVDRSSIVKAGSVGEVQMIIINSGLIDIKFLEVELISSENFEKISADRTYIGTLESDDIDTFEFKIYVKPTSEQNIILPLSLTYLDANNNEYNEVVEVSLRLYSGSELNLYGLKEKGNNTWIVVLLVAAGAGYIFYKKVWKKK